MKKFFVFIWEIFKITIIALAIVIPIRYFLFQPFFVKGQSMAPNFETGDYLIVDEISYRFQEPQRGEVIIFRYSQKPSYRFIKRIIGLPGEIVEIKEGKVIIYKNNQPQVLDESDYLPSSVKTPGNILITLGEDEYFVLGDNRAFSFDSRSFGFLPEKEIIGRVFIRAWPFVDIVKFEAPVY